MVPCPTVIIHLLSSTPLDKGIRCNISCIGVILPFSVFLVLLGLGAIFTTGVIKIIFLYLLILSSFGSYTDIYMFFYSMKHIKKNDIIFGLYKKENSHIPNLSNRIKTTPTDR